MKVLVLLCVVAVALAEKVRQKTCVEEPVTGMCLAYFPSFYYDPATQTCKQFIYGGCGGNGNRYETEEECLSNCAGVTVQDSDVSVCGLTAETGLCRAYIPRFHFDAATGQCKEFIYGGCGGNGNNFKSEKECQQSCGASQKALNRPDCDKKGETGPCRGNFPRFYYDQEEGMCKTFVYGGCGGNRNNFETEFDCQNKCGALASEGVSLCEQEKVTGPCRAYVPSYFFNKATGKCEFFVYGGCHGNSNRFSKQEDCENTCGVKQRALDRPDCDKKGETGPCKGKFPRFYYDQEEGMCKTFTYGGCGGNRNNFETEFDCYNKCGALASEELSLCEQEKVVGPCKAAFPSYFFNKATGKCEFFIYGGCRGNGNRFGKKEDCENTCGVSRASAEVCAAEPDTGMCRGYFPRFYYDPATKSCQEFIYGGCDGNDNNFETEEECKDNCLVARAAAALCRVRPDSGNCKGYFPRFYYDQDKGVCRQFIYGGCGGNDNNFETEEDCRASCLA